MRAGVRDRARSSPDVHTYLSPSARAASACAESSGIADCIRTGTWGVVSRMWAANCRPAVWL